MIPVALARSVVSPLFIAGGLDALRNPFAKAPPAENSAKRLAKLGIPTDPVSLVRANGGLQLGAGLLLFSGRVPRLASAALAASLVPTTLAGHRFWEERDPALRSAQKLQFMKNIAILGGLILLATDTKGAPSMAWRVKKTAKRTAESLNALGQELGLNSASLFSTATGHFNEASQRVGAAAGPLLDQAKSKAPSIKHATRAATRAVTRAVNEMGKTAGEFTEHVVKSIGSKHV